ncbi:hypothetical protein [Cryobacterium sp. TMT3-29-2]|uniref:hypothetical protein n=1 Tax=Cryobacterium sp. TMT3-29-2 TaxID=2555867 RepID=UPI001F54460A|nr:hypothetical protein [Cryobacterium sp. TMT3-29-2]
MANLDRFPSLGQAVKRAPGAGPRVLACGALTVGCGGQGVDPVGLASDLSDFNLGGRASRAVDVGFDLESGRFQGLLGAGDGVELGEAVAGLGDEPGADAAPPTPTNGLEDVGGSVAFTGAVDHGSGGVAVGDGEHDFCFLV